ncbi:MAG: metalloregulator ArsR/SmtB family transcription factor [Bryobacterales bacterium]|jgi:DNA-binding transcriptional ArsR family regulator|nr:metalloregulator ArsR/SmtB family transcription factor [Bryobacterales bacterium]
MELNLDDALRALADPTRRQILRLVATREHSAGELAKHFAISRPAVSQHLAALRKAKLIEVRAQAQQRLYSLNITAMEAVFNQVEHFWEQVFEPEAQPAPTVHQG